MEPHYVFVNLKNYTPLRYSAVKQLFLRLSEKTGTKITPHMLRHTHATELIHHGWDSALVQKRLGHASVQTTLDTYAHVDQSAMKAAFKGCVAIFSSTVKSCKPNFSGRNYPANP